MSGRHVAFTVAGQPRGKGRPRAAAITRANGRAGIRVYTPADTLAAEGRILAAYLDAAGGRAPHVGPVVVRIVATFGVPVSWPSWKRRRAESGEWPCTCATDVDNVAKAVLDALNGQAFVDDRQVVELTVEKRYGTFAATLVDLELLPEPVKA